MSGAATSAAAAAEATAAAFDPGHAGVLAEKVLHAWLRNRHQLLYPFAVDLRRLDAAQSALVVDAMLAAAQADGAVDGRERERIAQALARIAPEQPPAAHAAAIDAAVARRRPLGELLAPIRDLRSAALVYAASLMAVDQRSRINRAYLRYLAARLALPEDLRASLERRYRSSA